MSLYGHNLTSNKKAKHAINKLISIDFIAKVKIMKSEWIGGNIPFVKRSIYKKGVLLAEVFHQYSAAISKRFTVYGW
ncbi:hypothetical protein [Bartonella sp. MR168JLCBS]|uniref:hypothetical protein n=1 Tax=Bartonella sp. MR168JLCBS TaxID=3243556 RepID=UPI0035CF9243